MAESHPVQGQGGGHGVAAGLAGAGAAGGPRLQKGFPRGALAARLGDGTVRDIRVDVAARKVWVDYDNVRLGRRNIEVAVRHAGFAVNDLPADEEARAKLSPECRGDE